MSNDYYIVHRSCDGAGTDGRRFATLKAARGEALRRQADADQRGNPWGYTFVVFQSGRSGVLFRTDSATHAAQGVRA